MNAFLKGCKERARIQKGIPLKKRNVERAELAAKVALEVGGSPHEMDLNIGELLVNIQHLCQREKLVFSEIVRAAEAVYEKER